MIHTSTRRCRACIATCLDKLGLDARTRPRDYDNDPDGAHEVQEIRRVIVNSTEPVPSVSNPEDVNHDHSA